MRKKLIVGLVVLNGVLAALLVTAPAVSQSIPRGVFNCCKSDAAETGGAYCCESCCWFTWDCRSSDDCESGLPN